MKRQKHKTDLGVFILCSLKLWLGCIVIVVVLASGVLMLPIITPFYCRSEKFRDEMCELGKYWIFDKRWWK